MKIRESLEMDRKARPIYESMNGAEIAAQLGVSRQAVSQTLKRGLTKMYETLKKENNTGPFETAVNLGIGLCVDDQEYTKFFKLFPPAIRKQIEEDGAKLIRQKK